MDVGWNRVKGQRSFSHGNTPGKSPRASIHSRVPPEPLSLENSSVLGRSAQGRNVPGLTTLILIKGFMTKCEEEAAACAELGIIWSGYF